MEKTILTSKRSFVLDDEDLDMNALNKGQTFITSLMNATIEPIPKGDGMGVIRDVFNLETGRTRSKILRNITIPFWQACIDTVNTPGCRIRVAAVGTPGVGKTSTTPWLIRMLLEQGQTVVYLIRGSRDYFEFIPQLDGSITTNVYPESLPALRIPSLRLSSSYYIVDPSHTKTSCDPPVNFAAKVIIVPSPTSRHWGAAEFEKRRGDVWGVFRFFPTWSCEELLLARPILRPELTDDEVRERFVQLGGVPRHVFSSRDIDNLLAAQSRAIGSALGTKKAIRTALGRRMDAFDGLSEFPSPLFAFGLSADDNGAFKKAEPYLVSALVSEKICGRYERELWRELQERGPRGGGDAIFAMLTRHCIANGKPRLKVYGRTCVGKGEEGYKKRLRRTLGTGNKDVRAAADPIRAATTCSDVVFYPFNRMANTLFDFLCTDSVGHFHVFKAVSGASHVVDVDQMKDLHDKVGGASKLSFYFLVQSTRFPSFVTDPPNPVQADAGISCHIYHISIRNP